MARSPSGAGRTNGLGLDTETRGVVVKRRAHRANGIDRGLERPGFGRSEGDCLVPLVLTLDGVIGSRGGIPLIVDGKLIGAIGCSGGAGSQDELVCSAGAATINK